MNELCVGTSAWNEAMHSAYSVISDVTMGGDYPGYECRCTAPSPQTTSGGTMSVRYVSVYLARPPGH